MKKNKKCEHIWGFWDSLGDGATIAEDKETMDHYLAMDEDFSFKFDFCPYCGVKLDD